MCAATNAPSVALAPIVTPGPGGAAWTSDATAALARDIDATVAQSPAIRAAHVGILAVDTRTGALLYERNAGDAFQPASTLKLLVGSAALEKLGPDFSFTTLAYLRGLDAPAPPVQPDGALYGNVVLRGGGDPFLTAADLADFAAATQQKGIRRFDSLVIDALRYDDVPYADGWTWDDFAYDYAVPISAMTLEENVVHIQVVPGKAVGADAMVTSTPVFASGGVAGMPSLTWAMGCPPTREPIVTGFAATLAPGSASTLEVRRDENNCIVVSGGVALGAQPESIDAAVPSGPAYAHVVARDALRQHDVDPGRYQSFRPEPWDYTTLAPMEPGAPIVWSHRSAPLREWLGARFWIPSDNLVAELLLKELGYQSGGAPGTTQKGIAFERTWLQSVGVDPVTTTLSDGSGLSQYDRITPRDLVAILQHDWNGPYRALILASLPVGGARGTIEGIAGTPAAGRVFAKTGSMMHVRGLAGYLATQRHGPVTFVFTVDDWLGDYDALAAVRANVLSRIVSD